MRLVCGLKDHPFPEDEDTLGVVLYDSSMTANQGSAGGAIRHQIFKDRLVPAARAWDFLSLALAVSVADVAGHRSDSPDGWTREFQLEVATNDPTVWNSNRPLIEKLLAFLTTDKWAVTFREGGLSPAPPRQEVRPEEDCVVLLSGGLDSLVGAIDLSTSGARPFAVSHTVRGDAQNQRDFAHMIGGGLRHLQINHNADAPDPEGMPSQRARSIAFLAYGVLAATTLKRYRDGDVVTLYVCENGFISINPPLTGLRLGSLSTRTTHPVFLNLVQQLLDAAGLRVKLANPYQLKTKGEMLDECKDQGLLRTYARASVSCGRYKTFNYRQCGRCVPCLVRRASFQKWGVKDDTEYVYADIGRDDEEHAAFDDVRAVAMALVEVRATNISDWIGTALSTAALGNVDDLEAMVERGLAELGALLARHGVK